MLLASAGLLLPTLSAAFLPPYPQGYPGYPALYDEAYHGSYSYNQAVDYNAAYPEDIYQVILLPNINH